VPHGHVVEIEALDLAHRYGERPGLLPVSFAVRAPGALAVTGANGSGKSTLLRILSGLLHARAGRHRLTLSGRDVAPAERRHVIGLVSAELQLYEELTARENLAFAAAARGLPRPAQAVEQTLVRVGLESRADDRLGAFSSGMRQRLKLAFALQHEPAVLLLDEPGSHLDEEGRARVAALGREQAARGLLVVATNDEREVPEGAQRIALRGGGLGHPGQGMAQ
jgi:heme exporter protein A